MKKVLDKIQGSPVALYIHTYIHTRNIRRLEVKFRTSNFYDRKWGDWILNIGHSGDCL